MPKFLREEETELNKNKVNVLLLVRSVGPTSMPWNDLYSTARRIAPGMMYPPAVVDFGQARNTVRWIKCCEQMRQYVACNPLGALLYIGRLSRRSLMHGRMLIIHIHNPMLALIGVLAKLVFPHIKIVGNLHTDWKYLMLRHKLGLGILARISNRFIAVSCASKNSIPASLKSRMEREGRLAVILNGIDPKQMGSNGSRIDSRSVAVSHAHNSTKKVAIVAARMVSAKNCLFILRVVAHTRVIDRLIWFGDGDLHGEIESEIFRLGIGSRVDLRGCCPRNEVFQAMASGDIYLSASKWEGIGVANLEAAALGCWPFLSKIPPHDEIAAILDIPTFPHSDLSTWVKGIEDYFSLPLDKRLHMRNALAVKARDAFDLEDSVSKYIDLYRELADGEQVSRSASDDDSETGRR